MLRKWLERLISPRRVKDTVSFDEERVTRTMRNGTEETIRWDELGEVGIVTTSAGPWADDLFWVLVNADRTKGCAVPSEAEGMPALLERLQKLPAFDNQAVIRAMGSTSEASFVCWRRAPA